MAAKKIAIFGRIDIHDTSLRARNWTKKPGFAIYLVRPAAESFLVSRLAAT